MKTKIFYLVTAAILVTLIVYFNVTKPTVPGATTGNTENGSGTPPVLDTANYYNSFSQFIAGKDPGRYFTAYVQDTVWKNYAARVNREWNTVLNEKVYPIQRWADSVGYLSNQKSKTLFYPFAGADFLYANAFFPDVHTIIMIGLEPAGSVESIDTTNRREVTAYLDKLHKSIHYSNRLGYFMTKRMAEEFNAIDLNGTIHAVLFYMALSGCTISEITYFDVNDDGSVRSEKPGKAPAYKITYSINGSPLRTLYYFSVDLSNEGLAKKTGFLRFVDTFQDKVSLLKSASYLLHKPPFTVMKDYMLKNVSLVLQDDSGIPYRFFEKNVWDVKLFGKYTRIIDLFYGYFQPDLKKEFDRLNLKGTFEFKIGYNLRHGESNLILSTKR